jgi:hypothetical protein
MGTRKKFEELEVSSNNTKYEDEHFFSKGLACIPKCQSAAEDLKTYY